MPIVNQAKKIASVVGPVGLAVILLYFALRGIDTSELTATLKSANYYWLVPLIAVTLFSHWLRAWRWSLFLETVTQDSTQPASPHTPRVSRTTVFGSLMVGYMINNVTTRLGEVVKSGIVARREKISFSSVVGTVVIDRIIDMVVLGFALLSVLFLLRGQSDVLETSVYRPAMEQIAQAPAWLWVGLVAVVATLSLLIFSIVRSRSSRLKKLLGDFVAGLTAVLKSDRPVTIILLTVAMWFCYVLMAYIPFQVLEIKGLYSIDLVSAWIIMNIGALGIVVPAPGGIGSYHYITILILTLIYGVSRADAAAYAFLTHGTQLLLYTVVGVLFTLYFGLKWNRTSLEPEYNS